MIRAMWKEGWIARALLITAALDALAIAAVLLDAVTS